MKSDYYLNECKRISNVIVENQSKYNIYLEKYTNKIKTIEYSSGGLYIHRGYYCPSKIIDIISNASRGKIINNHSRYTFKYGFDENQNLIFVRQSRTYEFIKREGNFEIGIIFCGNNNIRAISECEYCDNNKLSEYKYFICDTKNTVTEMHREKYAYTSSSVFVNHSHFINNSKAITNKPSLLEEEYGFLLNNNQLYQYFVKQIYPNLKNLYPNLSHIDKRYFDIEPKYKDRFKNSVAL